MKLLRHENDAETCRWRINHVKKLHDAWSNELQIVTEWSMTIFIIYTKKLTAEIQRGTQKSGKNRRRNARREIQVQLPKSFNTRVCILWLQYWQVIVRGFEPKSFRSPPDFAGTLDLDSALVAAGSDMVQGGDGLSLWRKVAPMLDAFVHKYKICIPIWMANELSILYNSYLFLPFT